MSRIVCVLKIPSVGNGKQVSGRMARRLRGIARRYGLSIRCRGVPVPVRRFDFPFRKGGNSLFVENVMTISCGNLCIIACKYTNRSPI